MQRYQDPEVHKRLQEASRRNDWPDNSRNSTTTKQHKYTDYMEQVKQQHTTVKEDTTIHTYYLPGGGHVTGTIKQIEAAASASNWTFDPEKLNIVPRGYYDSFSKGLVEISSMHENHLLNALHKRVTDWITNLKEDAGIQGNSLNKKKVGDFLDRFVRMTEDQQIKDLFTELHGRIYG